MGCARLTHKCLSFASRDRGRVPARPDDAQLCYCRALDSHDQESTFLSAHVGRPVQLRALEKPLEPAACGPGRRYAAKTVDTLEALACLRSAGMSIDEMRACLAGVAEGLAAASRMAALFAGHAERLEQELAALPNRQPNAGISSDSSSAARRRMPFFGPG
jgi:DNA-binding transcriptional MerR regulator